MDNAFLGQYGAQINAAGISPYKAIAGYHRDPEYRNAISANIARAIGAGWAQTQQAIQTYVAQAIRQ
jgi:uncharacterized protein (DUF736 family)